MPPSRAQRRLALLFAILAAPLARAQDADGGVGETLEVSGQRPGTSPQAPGTSGATIEVARFSGEVRSIAELLVTSPGVAVHQSGAPGQAASLSLRGATAEESLILLDGIPLQGPGGGSIDLSTLLGGAVELVPRRAMAPLGGGAQVSAGSFGTAQLEADAATNNVLLGIQLDRTAGDFELTANNKALTFPDGTSLLQDIRARDNFLFTVASGSNSAQKIDLAAKGGPKIVTAASFGDGSNPYNILPLDDDQAIVTNRQTNSIAAAQWVVVP